MEWWRWSNAELIWFGNEQSIGKHGVINKMYKGGMDDMSVRGRHSVMWEDKVLEYLTEERWEGERESVTSTRNSRNSSIVANPLKEFHQKRLD